MADSHTSDTLDNATEELPYESLEPWAIVALVLGLAAPLAFAAPVLWFLPLAGVLVSTVALIKIRRAPGRPGRWLALVGLALGVFFFTAPLAKTVSTQWVLSRQARPVADQFLAFLREGSPQKAILLHMVADFRHPLDEGLWGFYRRNAEARGDLTSLVKEPAVRMILALGERANIEYYGVAAANMEHEVGQVVLLYTVTFTADDGRKQTYVIHMLLERKPTADQELSPWRIKNLAGGIDPER